MRYSWRLLIAGSLLAVLVAACAQAPAVLTPTPAAEETASPRPSPTREPTETEESAVEPDEPTPTPEPEERAEPSRTPETDEEPTPARPARDLPPDVEPIPATVVRPAVVGEVPQGLLADIRADLAKRADVSPAEIDVVRAEAVVWNDGSLGCPEPGMFYTQALVRGYWVVMNAGGNSYDYRVAENGYFFLCSRGGDAPSGRATPFRQPVVPVQPDE